MSDAITITTSDLVRALSGVEVSVQVSERASVRAEMLDLAMEAAGLPGSVSLRRTGTNRFAIDIDNADRAEGDALRMFIDEQLEEQGP